MGKLRLPELLAQVDVYTKACVMTDFGGTQPAISGKQRQGTHTLGTHTSGGPESRDDKQGEGLRVSSSALGSPRWKHLAMGGPHPFGFLFTAKPGAMLNLTNFLQHLESPPPQKKTSLPNFSLKIQTSEGIIRKLNTNKLYHTSYFSPPPTSLSNGGLKFWKWTAPSQVRGIKIHFCKAFIFGSPECAGDEPDSTRSHLAYHKASAAWRNIGCIVARQTRLLVCMLHYRGNIPLDHTQNIPQEMITTQTWKILFFMKRILWQPAVCQQHLMMTHPDLAQRTKQVSADPSISSAIFTSLSLHKHLQRRSRGKWISSQLICSILVLWNTTRQARFRWCAETRRNQPRPPKKPECFSLTKIFCLWKCQPLFYSCQSINVGFSENNSDGACDWGSEPQVSDITIETKTASEREREKERKKDVKREEKEKNSHSLAN